MSNMDTARIIYLVLLLLAVGSWVFVQNRQSLGKTVQSLAIWAFIFLGVIAAYGLWGDIRQTVMPQQSVMTDQGRVEVPLAPDGHYYLTLSVNGTPVNFLVDTGASQVVLSRSDAERAGIDTDNLAYLGRAQTANGEVRTASTWVEEMSLGGITDEGVRVWVNSGDMDKSLLGMGYLQRWSRIEIQNRALVLTR
ncbi:retropepsin-like aspartic protease family protein [Phycobacter azelaicus]|jgi:aspartyl protease family protein|uniref:retropepsin-like aspartic protease family protein n=1 Tax=Phycobacter azelaicus TaxID=2668075 RepID=UPI0018677059|nr:TIGR02281 family clan AA aspartic protease [Phycobacter azelaicus]